MSHFGLPTSVNPAPSTLKKAKKRVPRPSNCFIAYRMAAHRSILQQRPNINSKEVSQIVGKMWKSEPEYIKNHFRVIANQMKEEHASRYPDYCYNPKRRTCDPAVVNVEPTNEDTSDTTTRPTSYQFTSRSTRQTTPSYSQVSSLASSQATSDYDDWEELDIKSQCAVRNSNLTGIDIWGKLENESYTGCNFFNAANSHDCAMDTEYGALTFSASSSASYSSSQVTLQEYNIGHEPFMDSGMYVDAMHSSSAKWWHEPEEGPSLVNGGISPPFEGLTSHGLHYIPSLDNLDDNAF